MQPYQNVAEVNAREGDRYRVRATLGQKIVIDEGRATRRAAIRRRTQLLKERQFDTIFIVDLGDPAHPQEVQIHV